ncbi:MAG: hypothetical protein ACYCOX_16075, partial [Acidobacteriaceae bacterium]
MRKTLYLHMRLILPAALFLAGTMTLTQRAAAQGPQPVTPIMEQKIDAMVKKLTLAQKIALIGGEDDNPGSFVR